MPSPAAVEDNVTLKDAATASEGLDTPTPAPAAVEDSLAFEAAAAPEAAPAQAVVQGPTPWAWRVAEGLLAAGALLLAGLGLWRWGRARRVAR